MFAVISKGCSDADPNVNLNAINLIKQVMEDHQKDLLKIQNKKKKQELISYQENVIDSLFINISS